MKYIRYINEMIYDATEDEEIFFKGIDKLLNDGEVEEATKKLVEYRNEHKEILGIYDRSKSYNQQFKNQNKKISDIYYNTIKLWHQAINKLDPSEAEKIKLITHANLL